MEKLKVGDTVRIKNRRGSIWNQMGEMDKYFGQEVVVSKVFNFDLFRIKDGESEWGFEYSDIDEVVYQSKITTESRSKQISQSLNTICTKGLVIKSEDIIAKVKESIGTEYVFGDTILRSLRHLRQDGVLDYTANKNTREYAFK